ncbi:MAG: hypothetical protein CL583_18305 [Alteromonadaceae bacterium]|nr:hypothetical protein [Alteromonadaceae bacterium]|tara:strand:- start:101 stop:298 length:198 start_codon:yes stop_codon:yes gene_type:complete
MLNSEAPALECQAFWLNYSSHLLQLSCLAWLAAQWQPFLPTLQTFLSVVLTFLPVCCRFDRRQYF